MDRIPVMRARLWLFLVLGVLLGGGCSAAFAQYGGSMVPPDIRLRGPNNLPFDYSTGKYVGFGAGSGGGAALNSAYSGRLGGALVPISGTRAIPASALARVGVGLARLAGPVGLAMSLAPLIWDEAQQMWMREETSGLVPADGSEYRTSSGIAWLGSKSEACAYYFANEWPLRPGTSWTHDAVADRCRLYKGGDMYSTAYTVRGSSCAVGSYWSGVSCVVSPPQTVATEAQIEDAIYVELVARGFGSELARRLIDAGYEPAVIAEAGPQNLSGPSSVQGPSSTSTTTGPAGQTTVVTNTTYNITYQGDTISVTENTTTTTTHPDNSTETTTETKSPTTEAGAEIPPEDPPQTDCEKFPDASGCKPLDDVADEDLQQETENVTWGAEGGAAGSCPAPMNWATQFGTYAIEWTPICTYASGIRPFVIGISWLAAGLFIFMVAKEKA